MVFSLVFSLNGGVVMLLDHIIDFYDKEYIFFR